MNEQFLSADFLAKMGLKLDQTMIPAFNNHYKQTLNTRIIEAIVDLLDQEQLDQLSSLKQTAASDAEISTWLEANIPEIEDVIADEVAILLGEIAASSANLE